MDELLQTLAGIDELAAARANYAKSLALLRALKSGTVTIDDVVLTTDGWTVTKPGEAEADGEPTS